MSGHGAEVYPGRDAIDTGNGGSKVRTGQHDTVNDDQIITVTQPAMRTSWSTRDQGRPGSLSFPGDGPASLTVKETGLDLSELDVDNLMMEGDLGTREPS